MGRITVVTSGKGGAGKSTVSAGLGYALSATGASVLLVDGDAGLRSLDLMLGVGQEVVLNISDIFANRCEPIRAVCHSPVRPNLALLPAPTRLEELCSPEDMRRLCRGFSRVFDHVIVDCPAGTGFGFRTAIAAADDALVVTTPDLVCARDAGIIGDMLAEANIPARLIINRLRVAPVLQGKMPNLDTIIDTALIQLIGVIPDDEALHIAVANGNPLPEGGIAAACFENIARRMRGEEVPLLPLQKL